MPAFRRTRTPGVFIRHQVRCPAADADGPRCRCTPAYRGKRRHPITGRPEWSRSSKSRAEILTWIGAAAKGGDALREHAARSSRTLASLGDEWLDGVRSGAIAKRRGRAGAGYSDTTIAGYMRSWENVIRDELGPRPAADISEQDWQAWADRLARQGLSRSRIANHVAVASAIYAWASRPTRRALTGVHRNPLLAVELPANDEKPRLRVALPAEAAQLLAALGEDDRVPYAIAAYAGLRRAELQRLDWRDVELEDRRITVRKAKSAAGTMRRVPIAQPLVPILLRAHLRAGKPDRGPVCSVSVMSGKIAERAMRAWGWDRETTSDPWTPAVDEHGQKATTLEPITLHEFRHTYASLLMAAGYTLKEIMEYMGHADLQMVQRYVKLLPQPADTNAADRLDAYLAASTKGGA
jgi:integrase